MPEPRRTALYDAHAAAGAKFVEFAGWQMPIQYKLGIVKEHKAVRESIGIFDVSHMGEVYLRGAGALATAQRLVTNDVDKLTDGRALYTVMCKEDGGIIDDCIVYRRGPQEVLIILNAATTVKDLAWIRDHAGDDVTVDDRSETTALLAVQGPKAVAMLAANASVPLDQVSRFHFVDCEVFGVPCMAARTGYTGEDGFEFALERDQSPGLWQKLVAAGAAPIGLGARDTLRLEARLSLYGSDIDETTNPYEAGLGWVVKLGSGDFIGREALETIKTAGLTRKLVGFRMTERGIPRPGYPLVDRSKPDSQQEIGSVTSGNSSITTGGAIGMGYVPIDYAKPETNITVSCRGKDVAATVVKGPFYKAQ